ncbi:nitrilase family protein [Rhizobium sp. TRM96647]|uniref:nitrilase family protein n=1 Tax=unclassified Rhizobium TaxID=2613769 RepID=UPI0021E718EB|nr:MULTISPECIES: nitrilase family protein [unclassified Rhizobium]MCV3738663.1 nitrilase family protein [Rhizobium sp. TRM96647]MCV3760350.1 nitrilase family protein [Rhizobium sp. TRM96650]
MTKRVKEAALKVASIQMEPVFGKTAENVARSVALLEEAAGKGAKLAVLPELCNTGYVFESREELRALAEEIPVGPSTVAWIEAARRLDMHIVAGITERDGEVFYNSAVIVGPSGYVGCYRKVHLWGEEALYFTPGDLGFLVFDTPVGKIGRQICYDCWFPESFRLAALQGAELMCVPTNWVPIPGQDPKREAMANILVMAAAHSNSLFIVAADRVGVERDQSFIGQSLIVSHTGWPAAGPASYDTEEVLVAEVNLADARRKRNWNEFNQVLRDRRIDVYERMLGTGYKPGWY